MNPGELVITITDQGCQVQGPINDKAWCYSALELARDAVQTFSTEKANGHAPLIVPANPGLRIT